MKSHLHFQITAKSATFAVVIQWPKHILIQWNEVKTVGKTVQKFSLEQMQLSLCQTCITWLRGWGRALVPRIHTSRQKPRSLPTTGTKQSWQQCRKKPSAFVAVLRSTCSTLLLRLRIKTTKLSSRKTFLKFLNTTAKLFC